MRAYRIADRRYPIFDGTGARLVGGRWNSPGSALIYAAETFAGALLEVLAHANLSRLPRTHASVIITIPEDLATETLEPAALPAWGDAGQVASRAFGDRWLAEQRTAVLLVPSLVTGGREHNVLINPAHREWARITASPSEDVAWDPRLFAR
jgi:RES domain-containing protein